MKSVEEVCLEKDFYRWCSNQISSSTVISLEKMVSDVQPKVEKEIEK